MTALLRIIIAALAGSLFLACASVDPAHAGFRTVGKASYYWKPQRVASGGRFNPNALTAAHRTLPFGTLVRVTRVGSGRSVVVRINDRGPFVRGRIIDLSLRAARAIGMTKAGVATVRLTVLGRGRKKSHRKKRR
ncbi:MAG: septal ring lytic transglycosylase RlpA family protein [Hyphomicrobiaceae bacterium]